MREKNIPIRLRNQIIIKIENPDTSICNIYGHIAKDYKKPKKEKETKKYYK